MSSSKCEMVLRDLQSLLKKSIDDQVIVSEYETVNFLPIGENYGSTVLKVSVKIKRSENGPDEDLELVAKMAPATEIQRKFWDITRIFKREIFVFKELAAAYREVQMNAGLENLAGFLPKCFGSRLSLNPESEEADMDVVLLLENLSYRGYRVMDRKTG